MGLFFAGYCLCAGLFYWGLVVSAKTVEDRPVLTLVESDAATESRPQDLAA